MRPNYTYSLQRYGTWEWLEYEAPIVAADGPEWSLNAFGVISATIPASAGFVERSPDGRSKVEEWGVLVHAETTLFGMTTRHWTGIIRTANQKNGGWALTLVEFPGYLLGVPFEGYIRGVKEDPANMVRDLVGFTQSFPASWFGLTVVGSTSARAGTDLDDRIAIARSEMDARKEQLDSFSKAESNRTREVQDLDSTLQDELQEARSQSASARVVLADLIVASAPQAQIDLASSVVTSRGALVTSLLAAYNAELAAAKAIRANATADKDAAKVAYDAARERYQNLKSQKSNDGGAYEISGLDLQDTYKAMQDLLNTYDLDWTTETRYSSGAPDVSIRIHNPRAGRRRSDLKFSTSMNIRNKLQLERAGEYANTGVGVGAGEGPQAVRVTVNTPHSRMRRPIPVEHKSAKTNAQLRSQIRRELRLHSGNEYVKSIEVNDHPNCRVGSWSVGDIIEIDGVTTTGNHYSGLGRIVSWSHTPRGTAKIELEPTI